MPVAPPVITKFTMISRALTLRLCKWGRWPVLNRTDSVIAEIALHHVMTKILFTRRILLNRWLNVAETP